MAAKESNPAFVERLKLEGRFGAFKARRDELEAAGARGFAAYRQAAKEFGQGQTGALREALELAGSGVRDSKHAEGVNGAARSGGSAAPSENFIGVLPGLRPGVMPVLPLPPRLEVGQPESVEPAGGKPTDDVRRDHVWVYHHLLNGDTRREDAPSPGAWAMLTICRKDPEEASKFYTRLGKLLPTKTQIDAEARHSDDGRNVLRTIEKVRSAFKKSLLRAGAERPHSQSEL